MGCFSGGKLLLAAAVNSKRREENSCVLVNVGVCQGSCHTAATVCLIDTVISVLDNNGIGAAVNLETDLDNDISLCGNSTSPCRSSLCICVCIVPSSLCLASLSVMLSRYGELWRQCPHCEAGKFLIHGTWRLIRTFVWFWVFI